MLLKIIASVKRQAKERNTIIGKKEKLLFTCDMTAYVGNPRESMNNHY